MRCNTASQLRSAISQYELGSFATGQMLAAHLEIRVSVQYARKDLLKEVGFLVVRIELVSREVEVQFAVQLEDCVAIGEHLDVDNGTIVVTSSTNGFYAITAVATWTANSTGYRELYLERNSSYNVGWTGERAPSSDLLTRTVTATTYMLTSGSYIRFRCEQSSGGDLDLQNVRLYIGRVW